MPELSPPSPAGTRAGNAWKEARDLVWAHRGRLFLGFLLLGASRLAALALPASSKFVVDEVIVKRRAELLGPLAGLIVLAALVQGVSSIALSRTLGVAAQRAITDLRRILQAQVTRLPVRFFDSTKTGVLISRIMSDPDAVRNLMGTGLVQLAGSLLTAVLALGVLVWLDWRLTLVTLALLTPLAVLMTHAFSRLRPLFAQRAELNAQLVGRLNETLGGIRVVKAYRGEPHEQHLFTEGAQRLFQSVVRELTTSAWVGALAIVNLGVLSAVLVYLGGRNIIAGTMTLGDFVMFVFFIGLLLAPMVRLAETGTQMSETLAGLERMREIRRLRTEREEDAGREPLPGLDGEVAFEDVTFEYSPGVTVLHGISFRAPAGTTTALVGPSGVGKSTAINLVMGFETPVSGRVLVDGRDLARVRRSDYRAHLGVVLQETFLFDGTIAENIAYARPEATREEIRAAARIAHCDEFVDGLEKGYDAVVGERGVRLSGGQRQRVAIARAILADPRVLILDEATSHLDSESEALIQDGLRALRQGRTTFVIAHRLSTIRSADQILVLEGGRIVERGTHEALMRQGGRYRQLYDRQYRLDSNRYLNPGETTEPPAPESSPSAEPRERPGDNLPRLPWNRSAGDPL